MYFNRYFLAFLFLAAFTACKKKNTPQPDKPFVTDVYVVGAKIINNATYGVYWKNGVQVDVTTDINSNIYAVTGKGADVYLAGVTAKGATYWKNGTPVYLTSTARSNAQAIAVVNNDIYLAGTVYTPGDNYDKAVYWKNGTEHDLTDGSVIANAYGVAVNGNDVYVTGQKNLPDAGNTAGRAIAACWKNGIEQPLAGATQSTYGSFGRGITIYNGDVYVAGYIDFSALCWKNGIALPLQINTNSNWGSFAFTVAVNNGDIYVGGEHGNQAAYWKNNTIKDLITGPFLSSSVNDIAFQGTDVYMAGSLGNLPTYWLNDVPVTLANTGGLYGTNAIAVSRHQ